MREVQFDTWLTLERGSSVPLHLQLERELRDAVRSGRLRQGTALPSSRGLAQQLGVARGVVVEAYEQLGAEGYLETRPRAGTFVRGATASTPTTRTSRPCEHVRVDFHPGVPDLSAFPTATWQRVRRRVLAGLDPADLGYGDPRGEVALREALAIRLGRARGAVADPDRLLVVSGFTQGLSLACWVLQARGVQRVAVEDPGYFLAREVIRCTGLEPVGIPVDTEGMRVEQLAERSVGAVLVTPAHQCPTGHPLSPTRRAALLEWARSSGGYVFEDDYDAEYRYDREPVGTLQGLDPERVVYFGSVSKMLAPGLRLGWVLSPAALVDELAAAKLLADAGSPMLEQLTLAGFISDGHLDRHLRRMRSHYRARREALFTALDRWLPDVEVEGVAAGLYATTRLVDGTDERALLRAARSRGVVAYGRTWYAIDRVHAPPGLVLGYGNLPEAEITWGIRQLAHARDDAATKPSNSWGVSQRNAG